MIDIRNYKVVHKNNVYHGLEMCPHFESCNTEGQPEPATHISVIAMDLANGNVVQIYDEASEFEFVKVGK
jgi:hypothetical protein